MNIREILFLPLLADLKAATVDVTLNTLTIVFISGKLSSGDGLGGFYYWNSGDTTAEDTAYLNTVVSTNVVGAGRWNRVFQKAKAYAQGVLVTNGGVKTFYATSVTNSSGECQLNLTDDNTVTGNALFSTIWFNDSKALVNISSINDAISSCVKTESSDLKTTTHSFFRGGNTVISLLGTAANGFRAAAAGTTVRFVIVGT